MISYVTLTDVASFRQLVSEKNGGINDRNCGALQPLSTTCYHSASCLVFERLNSVHAAAHRAAPPAVLRCDAARADVFNATCRITLPYAAIFHNTSHD